MKSLLGRSVGTLTEAKVGRDLSEAVEVGSLGKSGQPVSEPVRDLERFSNWLAERAAGLEKNADYLANWAGLYALRTRPTAEIAIVGPDAAQFRAELDAEFYPNKVLCGQADLANSSELPLLEQRGMVDGKTTVYVCYNRACQLPVTSVAEVWNVLGR